MKIVLNNRDDTFEFDELTISRVIELKQYTFPRVVTKLNGKLIKKTEYPTTIVKDGDKLEIIHLISGG